MGLSHANYGAVYAGRLNEALDRNAAQIRHTNRFNNDERVLFLMKSANLACPITNVMGGYGIGSRIMLKIVRMNWRMTVMSIMACSGGSMHYNDIHRSSGLNPRTLSLVLKDLTESRLVGRKVESGPAVRVRYSLTEAGRKLSQSGCPFLEIAAGGDGSVKGRASKRR